MPLSNCWSNISTHGWSKRSGWPGMFTSQLCRFRHHGFVNWNQKYLL